MAVNQIPQGSATPQETDIGVPVRAVPQQMDRISFASAITGGIDPTWGAVVGSIGTGMTVNQTGGNLVIVAGTTAAKETIIRSTKTYTGGIRLRATTTLSQRIVNNNFYVELVDVVGDNLAYSITSATSMTVTFTTNPFTSAHIGQSMYLGNFNGTGTWLSGRYTIASVSGNTTTYTVAGFAVGTGTLSVFGWNYYQLQYTGATATAVNFDTQRKGWNSGFTAATINTTAAPGHMAIVTGNDGISTFADQTVASATSIQQTYRANRSQNVPDDIPLYTQIRCSNGSVAPASSTTWTVGLVNVAIYANQNVTLNDVRPMSAATALPVEITRAVALTSSTTVTANGGTPFANPVVALTGDTGAKIASGVGATITNANAKGAQIVINMGAVSGTTPTFVAKIQGSADSGTTWYDIPGATTASLTATGIYGIAIYPAITPLAASTTTGTTAGVSFVLPRTWRLSWTIGGTSPSFTITNVQVSYLL